MRESKQSINLDGCHTAWMAVRFPYELMEPTDAVLRGYVLSIPMREGIEHRLHFMLGIGMEPFDHGVDFYWSPTVVNSGVELDNLFLPGRDWREWTGHKFLLNPSQGGALTVHSRHCPATAKFLKFKEGDESDWLIDLDVRFDFTGTGFRSGSVKFRDVPCDFRGLSCRFKKQSKAAIKRAEDKLRRFVDFDAYEEPYVDRSAVWLEPCEG